MNRTINEVPLSAGIKVLAAINPYRRRPATEQSPGLVFQLGGGQTTPDPMAQLVYRVHPVPKTLHDFIFDFGALSHATESVYIASMVEKTLSGLADKVDCGAIAMLISSAQRFIRTVVGDSSAASLRDVKRCLSLLLWFDSMARVTRERSARPLSETENKIALKRSLATCSCLALALTYYYRNGKSEDREGFWNALQWGLAEVGRGVRGSCFSSHEWIDSKFPFCEIVQRYQTKFCSHIEVESGIAMNDALAENLFTTIVCVLNQIPIFIVGKPGSSKTLAIQIIGNNLLGQQSPKKFWRRFPAVRIVQYQCSPLSTASAITTQFELACSYQQHAENTICLLLLDEVGLAEHSPDMPLKALHAILVDPPIAVVGLSNWVLDPAKMNRAVLLQRPDASSDDLVVTAQRIIGPAADQCVESQLSRSISGTRRLTKWLGPLAAAYHEVYIDQNGRDFIGMRDYYQLVKLLREHLRDAHSSDDSLHLSPSLLTVALCRNFGGKASLMAHILAVFYRHCFDAEPPSTHDLPDPRTLIGLNLRDLQSRHLMILTRNGSAVPLLFGCGLLDVSTRVLIGSQFVDDQTELHLVSQIQEVKQAMAAGKSIVLHDFARWLR